MERKRKDYIVNKYWICKLGKNHKKHLSIAIIEKESQGIAKNNDAQGNDYIDSNYNKILRYTSYDYKRQVEKAQEKKKSKRRYY